MQYQIRSNEFLRRIPIEQMVAPIQEITGAKQSQCKQNEPDDQEDLQMITR